MLECSCKDLFSVLPAGRKAEGTVKDRAMLKNNEEKKTGKLLIRTAARMLLCLMLAVALVIPAAPPAEVSAASSSSSKTYTTAQTQYMCGINIIFSNGKVIKNVRLKSGPTKLNAAGKANSVKLSWTGVPNRKDINGYIIVRRDLKGNNWRQIATVKRTETTYTDKSASTKNRFYRYSVVAYKLVDGKKMVSTPAGWAGAITTRSKKKNVYSVKVSNPANVVSIMTGSCAQTYLTFPSKAYSKYIRWWSSNEKVAKVDSNGLITGVGRGTATIYAKTHTGSIMSFKTHITKPGTAQAMIETFYAWEGFSRVNGKQKGIIDIYNSITPWPVGYKMKYGDAWCDATVTAAAIKTGNIERIGRECSVPRHIKIFQKLGIWEEDGTITPRPGDIIVYSWSRFRQPNNASASHIGIVAKVQGNQITAIEGNRGIGVVATRTIPVGWGCIRGYARPKYAK